MDKIRKLGVKRSQALKQHNSLCEDLKMSLSDSYWPSGLQMSAWGGAVVSGRDAGAQVGQSSTPSTAKHSESWTGKTRHSSFEAEDNWTTKLRHDWAIPLEQPANRSHRRDTQHFNLQEQTQNISIQTVFPGRIETLCQLHERLCDGLAIKKPYTNVLYITLQ